MQLLISERSNLVVIIGAFALSACISHTRIEPSLDVDATIASVTLGDDCAARMSARAFCAEDGCGWCTQTGVRLTIDAAAVGPSVPFEVVRIRMYAMDGTDSLVSELDGRNAQVFTDDVYSEWDQMIHPGDRLHVTYDTTSPDWAAIGDGDPWTTYGMSFRIEMDVLIDGVEATLDFSPASREPEVVT